MLSDELTKDHPENIPDVYFSSCPSKGVWIPLFGKYASDSLQFLSRNPSLAMLPVLELELAFVEAVIERGAAFRASQEQLSWQPQRYRCILVESFAL